MTIERAIEILDPEHREHYDSIEPVNEACIMGMNALKELSELKGKLERGVRMSEYKRLTERKTKACTICRETRTCPQGICWIEVIYNRLQELEDKIESGRLVELPCKVDKTICLTKEASEFKEML